MTQNPADSETHVSDPDPAYPQSPADPNLWLEDVEGEAALAWVAERNRESEAALGTDRQQEIAGQILQILDSTDRIPTVTQCGEHLYNVWTDADHERGLWRRTTWESYRSDHPEWEILLDVDALRKDEGTAWVWHGARVLRPDYTKVLVTLSRGGSDADVTREFDLTTRQFVPDGFTRSESKGEMIWADTTGDTVLIFTDTGEGSMTRSGYPRTVRRWHRGTALEDSELLYEGSIDDMYIGASVDLTPGFVRTFIQRTIDFYSGETFELRGEDLVRIDVPLSAEPSVWRDWLIVRLRDAWDVNGISYPAGSLIAARYEDFLAGSREFTPLFTPTATTSLAAVSTTRHHVVVTLLDDVVNRVEVLTPGDTGWERSALDLPGIPDFSTISVGAVDSTESDHLWLSTQGYLTPATLSLLAVSDDGAAANVEELKSLPPYFDADGMTVTQHFVASADGTRIPYFQVTPAGWVEGTPSPTLLYGYGGFEVSLLPGYAPALGRGWLERGGVYVVANIRGGGEYGPAWHQSALKENRLRAYEDFAAVARDPVARGVTTPQLLGTQGGSNGGLLMGNMFTQYPELFGAVVVQVPLLDMKRYSHLLAGASWMAEYGDPDDPAECEFIKTFSPYQLLDRAGGEGAPSYPPVFFTTSTRDDRVHPGHARKMAKKALDYGLDVTYWENTEGGHGGAATSAQRAIMQSYIYEFLWQKLGA